MELGEQGFEGGAADAEHLTDAGMWEGDGG
jgi:hypothetical protein